MQIQASLRSTADPNAWATLRADFVSAQSELARIRLWPSARTAQAIARWVRLFEGGAVYDSFKGRFCSNYGHALRLLLSDTAVYTTNARLRSA